MQRKCRVAAAFFLFSALLLMELGTAAWAQAEDASISADLNAAEFPVDRAVLLTITIKGDSNAKPKMPTARGLDFSYQGQNSAIQWINGKMSSSIAYVFMVKAGEPGEYTIDPVKATVNGRPIQTDPVACKVLPAASAGAPSTGNPPAGARGTPPGEGTEATRLQAGENNRIGFIRIKPKKDTAYSGELVPFTIKAYFRQGIRASIKSAPRLVDESFLIQSMDDDPVQSEETVKGTPYTTLTWQGTLVGIKQGTFPMEVQMDTSLLVRNRRPPSSPFGSPFSDNDFFADFFGGFSKKEINLISPKQEMEMRDLPEQGKPENFSGAIGSFGLAVSAAPLDGKPGDPITLKMQVTGTGNFNRVQAPIFPENTNWKTYQPSSDFTDQGPGRGIKKFEQAIVPIIQQLAAIPPVSFSYFNPRTEEYISLSSDSIALHLQGNSTPTPFPPTDKAKETPSQQPHVSAAAGLAPIHLTPGRQHQAIIPLYKKPWFLILVGFSALLFCIGILSQARRKKLLTNPMLLRQRELTRKMKALFQDLEQAAAAGDSTEFMRISRIVIQERLGFSWQQEARAITLADLQNKLEATSPLYDLFRQVEQFSYTGASMTSEEMQEMSTLIKTELDKLP